MSRRSIGIVAICLAAVVVAAILLARQRMSNSAPPQAQSQQTAAQPSRPAAPATTPAAVGEAAAETGAFTEEEREALDQDIIHRAQTVPASELEPGLPSEPFESWLRRTAGGKASLDWEANDCGEQDGSGRQEIIPLCAEAALRFPDGREFVASIAVASQSVRQPRTQPQWSAKPALWSAWLQAGPNNGCSIRLADLAQWLTVPTDQISAKCKGKTP